MVFEYAGQEVATVHITMNEGNEIPNELIYGTIKGHKVNRETGEAISGAVFGLFRADETSFTENNALLTAESGEDGVFTFENVVYGSYTVRELRPAAGYLENETVYAVTVDEDGDVVEITVVNDLIPEIGTTASIDGEKEVCATEVFTLTDTVEYTHLVPGKEYTVKGILMDKATGEPFLQNGEQMFAEQQRYREWLLSQPPDEILNHCYEFTVREDIVLALEYHDLSDKQCKALLQSRSPLADVFKDFEKRETDHMDNIRDTIECRANAIIRRDFMRQQQEAR